MVSLRSLTVCRSANIVAARRSMEYGNGNAGHAAGTYCRQSDCMGYLFRTIVLSALIKKERPNGNEAIYAECVIRHTMIVAVNTKVLFTQLS